MPTDFERFEWSEIDLVPDVVGLYAWYYRPELRVADLDSEEETRAHLAEVAQKLAVPEMELDTRGHLGLRMEGRLRHVPFSPDSDGNKVSAVLGDERKRRLLAQVLRRSTPTLCAPIYIGIARRLGSRVRTHKNLIRMCRKEIEGEVPLLDETASDEKFATRVAERQLEVERLELYIQRLEHSAFGVDDLRDVVLSAEYALNRIFYPILGRN